MNTESVNSTPRRWHSLSIEEVLSALGTPRAEGLSVEEAQARLERYGPNELAERPRPGFWRLLLGQFDNFLILILLVACLISLFLGEYVDAGAIATIVVLNAALGVIQEQRAEKALEALKKMAAPEAHLIRVGHRTTVPVRELVPGDLVLLEAGNYVPADVRLVESANLRIAEASLTGESVAVDKKTTVPLKANIPLGDRDNMAYMGTMVSYGRGQGVVVATGMDTEIGHIAEMIQAYEAEPTPLQVKLDQLGKWLGAAALAICAIVFMVGVLRGIAPLEMFLTTISLAIAAVPEGLPAVVTICLALGMQRMARRHALLRKLPAVETLGSATVICSDKTGTLTRNEMTVVRLWADRAFIQVTGQGYEPKGEFYDDSQPVEVKQYPALDRLLQAILLCNDARLESDGKHWRMVGDSTEGAMVVAAAKAGLWREELEKRYPRVEEVPFDSERKRMTTIHQVPPPLAEEQSSSPPSSYVAYVKGAPDIVLGLCDRIFENGGEQPLDDAGRVRVLETNDALSSGALRVLGVAYRRMDDIPAPNEVENDLVFLGLVGMIDPVRPEVKDAIQVAREAGLRTVMVTGDYRNTAVAIARELGLYKPGRLALMGVELDEKGQKGLAEVIDKVDVYTRVSPKHKVMIVEALKDKGHVVAMTGDGVNDAPALKRADIGVAMGITGTDVAKETADMVLTDDNYVSIVSAVEEGRIIYSNVRKFVYYLLSCNVGEILIIFLATIAGAPLPLTAVQLLMLNLITDGAPALALGLEKGDPDIMKQPPRPVGEPVINRQMTWGILIQSAAMAIATLAAFALGLRKSVEVAQTMAFVTLSFSELLRAYTARSERYSLWAIGPFSNKYMQWAVALSLSLLLAIVYVPFLRLVFGTVPLGKQDWMTMAPFILLPAFAAEINKWFLRRRSLPGAPLE